jgi:hypothetical protein
MKDEPAIVVAAILIVAASFLGLVAWLARSIGADFTPTIQAVGISVALLLLVGMIWWFWSRDSLGSTNWWAYGFGLGAMDWWVWWRVLDSIAVNKIKGPSKGGILSGLFDSTTTSPWGIEVAQTVPDVWFTSWYLKWGVEIALVAAFIFIITRQRKGY